MEDAWDTLTLTDLTMPGDESSEQWIVALDFSGNPTKKSFTDFEPVFQAARDKGLHSKRGTILQVRC